MQGVALDGQGQRPLAQLRRGEQPRHQQHPGEAKAGGDAAGHPSSASRPHGRARRASPHGELAVEREHVAHQPALVELLQPAGRAGSGPRGSAGWPRGTPSASASAVEAQMKPVRSCLQPVGDVADVGADHRPHGAQGLLDHRRRGLVAAGEQQDAVLAQQRRAPRRAARRRSSGSRAAAGLQAISRISSLLPSPRPAMVSSKGSPAAWSASSVATASGTFF